MTHEDEAQDLHRQLEKEFRYYQSLNPRMGFLRKATAEKINELQFRLDQIGDKGKRYVLK